MKNKTFTIYDIIVSFMSLFSYIFDVGSDILLIVVFFTQGHQIWASLSLAFVAAATFFMQIFSFCWHVTDRNLTWKILLTHALFLAPLHRYIDVIRLGLKARRTRSPQDLDAVFRANNDVCLLRLFESFTESAPQLVLQLYIILNFQEINWVIGLCTALSLISLAWSMTAYTDGLRLAYKDVYNRKWLGMMVHSAWQVALIASRVMAMVVFATVYKAWVFLAVGIHWCLMTAWVTLQNADFGETACEKRIFNSVVGFIYIFCFLNLKDSRARWRLLAYHIITVVENSLLILLWFLGKEASTPVWLEISTVVVVFGGFICGGLFMVMYYCCCHPTGVKPQHNKEHMAYWFKRLQNTKEVRRDPIFDTPNTSTGRVASWLNASLNLSGDFIDSKSVSSSPSGGSNVPDILKCQGNDRIRMLNNSSNISGYHGNRNCSPATTFESGDSYVTRDSGKASYISATSTRHLIDSESNISAISNDHRYHSHQHPYVATVPRSIGREEFSEIYQHNLSQNSSSGIELDKSRLSSLSNTSRRLFSVTDGLAESILSCSYHSKSHFSHDSFYSSPEYKSGKLSPLNAKQLWEESQSRLANNLKTRSITIVTQTDLDRLCSHSTVTWNKSDTDPDLHHNKSLHGEYDESHFHSNASYLQNNHTKSDHNYALSSSDDSSRSKALETSLSPSGSSMESNISSQNSSNFTSNSNSCYPNRRYSSVHDYSEQHSSTDSCNTYSDTSVPQHSYNSKDLVFSDIAESYNPHLERSAQNYDTRKFGSDSCSYDKSYTDSGSSYVSESQDRSGCNSTASQQSSHRLASSIEEENIPYADEDVEDQSGSGYDLSALSSNQSGSVSAHTRTVNGSENILSDWFGDISSLRQSKQDLSRFWASSASGLVNVPSEEKDVSDTCYKPENISSSGNQNNSSISLYQYRNSSCEDDEESERSYRDELRLKSSKLTSAYATARNGCNSKYGKKTENYGMHSSLSASEKSSYSTPSPYSCTNNENSMSTGGSNKAQGYDISPILSERSTDDSGYHRSKSGSSARGNSETLSQEFVQPYDTTNASDQIVPGEESFSKYGDSTGQLFTQQDAGNSPDVIADIPAKSQQTPIKVNNFETSPNKLGRNVDLFKRLQYEESLQKEKRKQKYHQSQRKQEFQLSDLAESPYKFRSHLDTSLTKLTGSPYKFRSRVENLPQLTESPYKFRSRKSDPLGHLQDANTGYSAKSCSKLNTYSDKENKLPQDCSHSRKSCPTSIHSKKKDAKCNTARFIQMNTGAWQFQQETDLDATSLDFDKQPYVPSFGNKGLKRRGDQLDIPVTEFCYGYSSDEDSHLNENEVVIPGLIETADNTPGFATVPRTEGSKLNSRLSASSSDVQRRVLQALENTPGFSPIIVPEELQRIQNNSSGRIVKPVVSTPRLALQSFSGSYQQLATLEPRNSTVDV